ncbi:serine/threonine-protein kinase edr1 [Anaeramoeba flamelloides]|uniref:Serine/threonine-protein kinase edr1 n=1 Tax=Anaeramoeba flamelloides TaxID=1746091 RepID=A0AAV8A971_9EUKA|nr:serine/threonine-protein kinase edr1 [Anaeramoeba flamelloides]
MWSQAKGVGRTPSGRHAHGTVVWDKKILFFGGYSKNSKTDTQYFFNDFYTLDTGSLKWSRKRISNVPPPRAGHTFTIIPQTSRCILFGGSMSLLDYSNELYQLDFEAGKWYKYPSNQFTPNPRHGHTMNVISKHQMCLFGGYNFSQGDCDFYNDLHLLDFETMNWKEIECTGDVPKSRDKHTLTCIGRNQYLLFGGHNFDQYFSEVHILDVHTQKWMLPEIRGRQRPMARDGHTTIEIGDGRILLWGGSSGGENFLKDLWTMDPREMRWKKQEVKGKTPGPRSGHSMDLVDGRIFVFGGLGIGENFYNDLSMLSIGHDVDKFVKKEERDISIMKRGEERINHMQINRRERINNSKRLSKEIFNSSSDEWNPNKKTHFPSNSIKPSMIFNPTITTNLIKNPEITSKLYYEENILNFNDIITDGFYDGGRGNSFFSLEKFEEQNVSVGDREVLVINAKLDKALETFRNNTVYLLSSISEVRDRILLLSLIVSDLFGGSHNPKIVELSVNNIRELKVALESNVIPIGHINFGLCRHRAIMFKYLADCLNIIEKDSNLKIPCKLVRGVYARNKEAEQIGGHVWNVVRLSGNDYVLDVMFEPAKLQNRKGWRASKYFRIKRKEDRVVIAGGTGASLQIASSIELQRGLIEKQKELERKNKKIKKPKKSNLKKKSNKGNRKIPSLKNKTNIPVETNNTQKDKKKNLDEQMEGFSSSDSDLEFKTSLEQKLPKNLHKSPFSSSSASLEESPKSCSSSSSSTSSITSTPSSLSSSSDEEQEKKNNNLLNKKKNKVNEPNPDFKSSSKSESENENGDGGSNDNDDDDDHHHHDNHDQNNINYGGGNDNNAKGGKNKVKKKHKKRSNSDRLSLESNKFKKPKGQRKRSTSTKVNKKNEKMEIRDKIITNKDKNDTQSSNIENSKKNNISTISKKVNKNYKKKKHSHNHKEKEKEKEKGKEREKEKREKKERKTKSQENRKKKTEKVSANMTTTTTATGMSSGTTSTNISNLENNKNKKKSRKTKSRNKYSLDLRGGYNFQFRSNKISWKIKSDKLRRVNILGVGSIGVVYRTKWLGIDVAQKTLFVQNFDKQFMETFKKEVSIMSEMRHPNIVQFLGGCFESPNISLIHEYLPKKTLRNVLRDPKFVIDANLAINWAIQIAKGMYFLHHKNVLHGDLKTENILVANDLSLKISDFGLDLVKKKTSSITNRGMGSPVFLSPETLKNENITKKSDVYSFSIILWEIITRELPFQNLTPMQTALTIVNNQTRPTIPQSCPKSLEILMKQCWDEEPKNRPEFEHLYKQLEKIGDEINKMHSQKIKKSRKK